MFNELLAWIASEIDSEQEMQDTIDIDNASMDDSKCFHNHDVRMVRFNQSAAHIKALRWLIVKSAVVAHSSDGDCCWVCWYEDEDEYRTNPHGDAMTAIHEGMRMTGDIVTHADIIGAETISG